MASILKLDTLQTPSGTGVITSPNTIVSPGSVIQVQQFSYAGTTSWTSTSPVGILQGIVTPKSTNSRFLVSLKMRASHAPNNSLYFILNINGNRDLYSGGRGYPSATGSIYMELYGNGHSSNAQIDEYNGEYLYQHSGMTAITFLVEAQLQGGTGYMNYAYSYDDSARGRPMSTLTVQEIAQ
jgi:hypothetical protein